MRTNHLAVGGVEPVRVQLYRKYVMYLAVGGVEPVRVQLYRKYVMYRKYVDYSRKEVLLAAHVACPTAPPLRHSPPTLDSSQGEMVIM